MIGKLLLAAGSVLLSARAASPSGFQQPEPAEPLVVLLVSPGPEAYQQAEQGVREALVAAIPASRLVSIVLEGPDGPREAKRLIGGGPSVVVAIGSRAARVARENASDVPLVYSMVLDPGSIGLPAPGETPPGSVTGVAMDVTPDRQFELLHEMIPALRRIGVLYDPAVSGQAVRRAVAAARARGLTLVAQAVRSEGEVLSGAALLAPEVDALWAIADPTVLTVPNSRALILFSLRARKPLFAISEGFVRTGALAALSADPEEVGRRAGELALRVLQGTPAREIKPEFPPRLSLFVNRASAERLGVSLPERVVARAQAVYPQP